jgi:hypothetical protein
MADDLAFPKSLPEFQRLFPDDAACAVDETWVVRVRSRGGSVADLRLSVNVVTA